MILFMRDIGLRRNAQLESGGVVVMSLILKALSGGSAISLAKKTASRSAEIMRFPIDDALL